MVTLTEGEQPLEQYEMVLFIFNSFLPQLGYLMPAISASLGGITCGAIDEPRKSSKAIDEHVIINFHQE